MECEEPKCRVPASKDWNGRAVCQDCYEKYKDEKDKIHFDLDD